MAREIIVPRGPLRITNKEEEGAQKPVPFTRTGPNNLLLAAAENFS